MLKEALIASRLLHPPNTLLVSLVSPSRPWTALSGMLRCARDEQLWKALDSIETIEGGMVIEINAESRKASLPIEVKVLGITTEVRQAAIEARTSSLIRYLMPVYVVIIDEVCCASATSL